MELNNEGNYIEIKKQMVGAALQERLIELEKILPKDVFDFKHFYFAGGCIYSLWNGKEPKDYDIFCLNARVAKKLIAYFKKNKSIASFITSNAISLGKYQFIIKYIGKPEIEVNKFDFKHNMFYYDDSGLNSLVEWKYLDSNKLAFNTNRARDIFHTIARIPKFVERGMEISQTEIYSIMEKGTRPTKILRERRSIKQYSRHKSGY